MRTRGRAVSNRIQTRQEQGEWASFADAPPADRPCETCGTVTEQQLSEGPSGSSWCCRRCGRNTGHDHVFDPRRPPAGDEEFTAAADCLVQHVMALRTVGPVRVLPAVRDHFAAGWCVRDVVHALNYRPDGEHFGHDTGVWSVQEAPAKTLARLTSRLAVWRWSEGGEGTAGAVMPGEWTATRQAMSAAARAQAEARAGHDAEWHERAAAAAESDGRGAAAARMIAAAAASRGRLRRAVALLRDRARSMGSTGT
jgi:hypothetical protein